MKASVVNNNANPKIYDGIRFDSEYECEVYKYCKEQGLDIEHEPERFTFTPKVTLINVTLHSPIFDSAGHKVGYGVINNINRWTYTPDFVIRDNKHNVIYYIEAKGQITEDFKHKWKMFLNILNQRDSKSVVYLIQRKGDLVKMVEEIKSNLNR